LGFRTRALGEPLLARGSATSEEHLECRVVELLRGRQCRSVRIEHRGRDAVSEQPRAIGREGDELVEADYPKSSQWIDRAVGWASTNPYVDCDGRREPGILREVHSLQRCLIDETEERGPGGVGLSAESGPDRVSPGRTESATCPTPWIRI
jgi:hypothetical protein